MFENTLNIEKLGVKLCKLTYSTSIQHTHHLKHLPSVEPRLCCPQAFLSSDFHCRMDVRELNSMHFGLEKSGTLTAKTGPRAGKAYIDCMYLTLGELVLLDPRNLTLGELVLFDPRGIGVK